MKINNNISALNTYRQLSLTQQKMQNVMQKLSTGRKINDASDDAAGLGISEKMKAQIRGLDQAERNALDAVSLAQTAEGALGQIGDILQRIRELTVQSANGVYTNFDRECIKIEVDQLLAEITRISETTQFNTKNLINGDLSSNPLLVQVGANAGQLFKMTLEGADAEKLGIKDLDVSSTQACQSSLERIDTAIKFISQQRSDLGAYQNRLEHVINSLGSSSINLTAALSRVEDADMAIEMTEYTRLNILTQASQAMLAQANQMPQSVLQLLK